MRHAPELLRPDHVTAGFDCGVVTLDAWLQRRAAANQASGASRTFVACENERVLAYYALASGAIAHVATPGRFKCNMPDPVPVVVLGRLAVDRRCQGQGLGRALFQDAVFRVVRAADAVGIRGMIVHALSEDARAFYLNLGLDESPLEPMTLMATMANLRAAIEAG